MRNYRLLILAMFLFVTAVFSQETRESGEVGANIDFTTYKGESYDLHTLLDEGKHVYILSYKYPG